jgi:hypothetical protein
MQRFLEFPEVQLRRLAQLRLLNQHYRLAPMLL